MVISEMVASANGIGYFVLQSQRSFAITEMWSGILLLGLLGYLLNALFLLVERRVLAWHRGARAERAELTMLQVEHLKQDLRQRADATQAIADVSFEVDGGRVRLRRRPVGLRQDDAAEVHQSGLLEPTSGAVELDGKRVDRPARAAGARLPGLQPLAVPVDDRAPERRVPAARSGPKAERAARSSSRRSRSVGLDGFDRPVPVAALRRHAAARGDRPRARLPAGDPADGRAVRVRRRADARRPRGPRAAGPRTTTA